MRESPRNRRLRNDRIGLEKLRSESTILDFSAIGDPTEKFVVRFHGKGLWRPDRSGAVVVREVHEVKIELGAAYPRMMPDLHWVTPIFHPNISASGVVCLGGYGTYWVPSLSLDELCEMLWDMIRYQNFDVESPYNREAAFWAKSQKDYWLPVDPRHIRDKIAESAARPPSEGGASGSPKAQANEAQGLVVIDDGDEEIINAEVVDSEDQDILFLD